MLSMHNFIISSACWPIWAILPYNRVYHTAKLITNVPNKYRQPSDTSPGFALSCKLQLRRTCTVHPRVHESIPSMCTMYQSVIILPLTSQQTTLWTHCAYLDGSRTCISLHPTLSQQNICCCRYTLVKSSLKTCSTKTTTLQTTAAIHLSSSIQLHPSKHMHACCSICFLKVWDSSTNL